MAFSSTAYHRSMVLMAVNFVRTGYIHMREANTELLGKNVIDQTEEVYGLDDEGEIKGSYRPSGHPGVGLHRDYI